MHVEIQVALNFLISFLFNKLPRRRVNQFGEELENALKIKFEGHWYPEKPYKGSAYRCVRCSPPLDPTVFETASRACGMDLSDIQENLPQELSIWIDPGEVSYRMSEKGPVKILYSEHADGFNRENADREVIRTFNPEAQCFKPIECIGTVTQQFGGINISNNASNNSFNNADTAYKNNALNAFMSSKTSIPVTFTTASFAQTKFGSTKLKSNSKRSQRMSPTEFSNYIKQRALQQHASQSPGGIPQQLTANNGIFSSSNISTSPHNSRSLSPNLSQIDSPNSFMMMTPNASNNPPSSTPNAYTNGSTPNAMRNGYMSGLFDNGYLTDIGTGEISKSIASQNQQQSQQQQQQQCIAMNRFASFLDKASPYISSPSNTPTNSTSSSSSTSGNMTGNGIGNLNNLSTDASGNGTSNNSPKTFDNLNYNLNGVSYPNQYQHLLVAN